MDGPMELELLNRFSAVLPWLLWRLPLAVMLLIWGACVAALPRRRILLALAAAGLILAATLFGGEWLLGMRSLTYRTWLRNGLSTLLWVSGLALGVFSVGCFHALLRNRRPKLAPWGLALGLYCLVCVMFSGTVLGGLWAAGPGEEVGIYQSQTVVQGRWTWMETSYCIYEYHGPFVRGSEVLACGHSPLLDGAKN